jgi:preprotein translocase subunit SecD
MSGRAWLLAPIVSVVLTAAAIADPLVLEVKDAVAGLDQRTRDPILTITLTPASQQAFGRLTAANVGRKAEMRIDGKVVLAPIIREPILGGTLQISGRELGDVRALASRLSIGDVRLEVGVVAD